MAGPWVPRALSQGPAMRGMCNNRWDALGERIHLSFLFTFQSILVILYAFYRILILEFLKLSLGIPRLEKPVCKCTSFTLSSTTVSKSACHFSKTFILQWIMHRFSKTAAFTMTSTPSPKRCPGRVDSHKPCFVGFLNSSCEQKWKQQVGTCQSSGQPGILSPNPCPLPCPLPCLLPCPKNIQIEINM